MDRLNPRALAKIRPKLLQLTREERAALYRKCKDGTQPPPHVWRRLQELGFTFEGALRNGLRDVVLAIVRPGGDMIQ